MAVSNRETIGFLNMISVGVCDTALQAVDGEEQ
jgi:hypothetical protein